jgi:putative ABC transport system permease protein
LQDSEAIDDPFAAPHVVGVAPVIQNSAEVTYGGQSEVTSVNGVTPDYTRVRNYPVTEGEFISQEHMLGRAAVAVIGVDTADKLFGRKAGVTGETIRVEGQPFRIIGLLKSKGGSSFGSGDNIVLVPMTTAQARLSRRALHPATQGFLSTTGSTRTAQMEVRSTRSWHSSYRTRRRRSRPGSGSRPTAP